MAVFYGQAEPLQRLRSPLQQLVRERILQGREPTESNISAAVERLIDEMQTDLESTCVRMKPLNLMLIRSLVYLSLIEWGPFPT